MSQNITTTSANNIEYLIKIVCVNVWDILHCKLKFGTCI